MARTELTEVVEKIRRQVCDAHRTEVDTLSGLMADDETDTTVDLTYATSAGLQVGTMLSIGMEDMRIMAVDASAQQVTVIRAWGDSDVEMHDPDDVVWIAPRFSSQDILDALRDEIMSWGPALYKVLTDEVSTSDGDQTVELPVTFVGMYGLVDCLRFVTPPTGTDPTNTITAWPRCEVRLQRHTTDWSAATTSGILLRFIEPSDAATVLVSAAMPFDTAAFDTPGCDLVSDVGLRESMIDLAALGVKMRLLVDAEALRSSRNSADDPRRDESVPPGAALQSANAYQSLYRKRVSEEVARLAALYPIRMV